MLSLHRPSTWVHERGHLCKSSIGLRALPDPARAAPVLMSFHFFSFLAVFSSALPSAPYFRGVLLSFRSSPRSFRPTRPTRAPLIPTFPLLPRPTTVAWEMPRAEAMGSSPVEWPALRSEAATHAA